MLTLASRQFSPNIFPNNNVSNTLWYCKMKYGPLPLMTIQFDAIQAAIVRKLTPYSKYFGVFPGTQVLKSGTPALSIRTLVPLADNFATTI